MRRYFSLSLGAPLTFCASSRSLARARECFINNVMHIKGEIKGCSHVGGRDRLGARESPRCAARVSRKTVVVVVVLQGPR